MPDSLDQVGTGAQIQGAFKSNFTSTELNNSAITGVSNELIGSPWDWDDDDRGVDDIEDLLSHFGGFGDFFENDVLPFGEVFSICLCKNLCHRMIIRLFLLLHVKFLVMRNSSKQT